MHAGAMPYIRVLRDRHLLFDVQSRTGRPSFRSALRHDAMLPCAAPTTSRLCLKRRIGEQRHVSADGKFAWLEVECLGACCNAPMVQINDDYFEDLTPELMEKLLDDLAAGRPVKTDRRSAVSALSRNPARATR